MSSRTTTPPKRIQLLRLSIIITTGELPPPAVPAAKRPHQRPPHRPRNWREIRPQPVLKCQVQIQEEEHHRPCLGELFGRGTAFSGRDLKDRQRRPVLGEGEERRDFVGKVLLEGGGERRDQGPEVRAREGGFFAREGGEVLVKGFDAGFEDGWGCQFVTYRLWDVAYRAARR